MRKHKAAIYEELDKIYPLTNICTLVRIYI